MPDARAARPGRRPGPKPRLNRDAIVDAAVAVGVDRLSVAAVADRLGAAPGSLYRYVDGLDDLAAAAVARVFAAAPLPAVDRGWRAFLVDEADLRYDLLMRYSGLVRDTGADLTAIGAARMEAVVGVLTGFGFTPASALRSADAVLDIVADGVNQIRWLRNGGDSTGPDGLSAAARAVLAAYSPQLREELRAIMLDPRAHLLDKVDLVLDGVEARHGRTEPPA